MVFPDEELLERFRSGGDRGAGEALFLRHVDAVYNLCLRVLGRPDLAEDAAQETFLKFLKAAPGFRRGMAGVRSWLLGIAAHAALDLLRAERRSARREEAARRALRADRPDSPAERTERAELARAARRAVDALDAELRVPVVLCCMEGLRHEDAARALGISRRAVGLRVERGLAELRRRLGPAGASASPAVLGFALRSAPAANAPASLTNSILELSAAGGKTALVTGTSAAKGGLSMKLIAGVVLAGAALGAAVLALPGRKGGSLYSPPSGPFKYERFALAGNTEYLDGPRLEAMRPSDGTQRGGGDAAGNFYCNAPGLCVARADNGMVETVTGDCWWAPELGLEEAPAVFFQSLSDAGTRTGYLRLKAVGDPPAGEDKGCIYIARGGLMKIFRNKEKDGRWWFRRLDKRGGAPPPAEAGKSAAFRDTDMSGMFLSPDCAFWQGNVYRLDFAKGELTCVLALADYATKACKEDGKPLGEAESAALAQDGTVYLQYYGKSYPDGRIFRVPADRSKVEQVVHSVQNSNRDGPGLQSGFFCGPSGIGGSFGNVIIPISTDSNVVRRLTPDGRVSSLFRDGEWRESPNFDRSKSVAGKGTAAVDPEAAPYVWTPYPGEEMAGAVGIYRAGPIDFAKPTVK